MPFICELQIFYDRLDGLDSIPYTTVNSSLHLHLHTAPADTHQLIELTEEGYFADV
jgi:hypothetical protein